ncbi:hypothetical protein, partial [Enterobacter cloacae]|uniref:hypothetical protein n=1 Tax=Enterobacter cloacae TaxID=550 RepID=UPI0021D1FA91
KNWWCIDKKKVVVFDRKIKKIGKEVNKKKLGWVWRHLNKWEEGKGREEGRGGEREKRKREEKEGGKKGEGRGKREREGEEGEGGEKEGERGGGERK